MTTKRSVSNNDTNPNAWIVNPQDRGRKSIKSGNKIYLQNGQEFQIELHNPLTESVLSDIRVNGKSVSSSGLILRPGERFYLDCFVDDKKKFVFKTYEVENTSESKSAIVNNGSVEIFFYKEETVNFNNWTKRYDRIIERHYYPQWYPWSSPWVTPYHNPIIYGVNTSTGIYNSTNTTIGGGYTGTNKSYSSSFGSLSGDINFNSNIETGRIEKGETSSQEFVDIDMEFQKYHIASVMYQLLPESQKPVEVKDIKNADKETFKLIENLKSLFESGILTEEEYSIKKKQLIERL